MLLSEQASLFAASFDYQFVMPVSAMVQLWKQDAQGLTLEVALNLQSATAFNAAGEAIVKADDGKTLLALLQSWGYVNRVADLSHAA